MITDRDKLILNHIEKYKAITIKQATDIYFEGNYRGAARRLQQLEEMMLLKSHLTSYIRGKCYQEPTKSPISDHDLLILDFYSWIYKQNGEVIDFKTTPHYFKGLLIPDALVTATIPFEGHNYKIYVLLEIDYTHYTENTKLNTWYEKLYREGVLKDYCGTAEFPFIVIARPTPGIRYNSNNFNIVYTDLNFSNLLPLMLS